MNKDYRASVQLTRQQYDYIKKLADQTANSISAIIRWLIIQDMHQKQ